MTLARERGGLGERLLFYAMSASAIVTMKTVRASLFTLVPILANNVGLSLPQRALLMAAFFPGYSLSQVPGGVLVQYCGGKHVLTLALGATGALFGLLPALIRAANPRGPGGPTGPLRTPFRTPSTLSGPTKTG